MGKVKKPKEGTRTVPPDKPPTRPPGGGGN